MKSITIKGSKRESVGKVATKALRNAGKVPCVLYGGEQPVHFSADEVSFKNLVYTPSVHTAVIELESGESFDAILQDIQFHPVSDKILHIDFYQLFAGKLVTMTIPVKLSGSSKGVLNGGRLLFTNRKLSVRALPKDFPDFIAVDITELKIGDNVSIADVHDEKLEFLHPDNMAVVRVAMARTAVAVDEEEEGEGEEGAEEGAEASTEETAAE
ncbi:MAG: 50S ribosomal protein L25/general stress protein Ctc [Flavobacteriaceae bacterium]|nr:MAG: 50S ribosomal protein L25/general stress protein Ctc [Flavobacteriaceae bacterium]